MTNNHLMQVKSSAECSSEHSAFLMTCIKLPCSSKTIVLCIFEWPLKTGLTVVCFFLIYEKMFKVQCKRYIVDR